MRAATLFTLSALILCLLPALAYYWFVARAPQVTAEQARELLSHRGAQVVFLDPTEEASKPLFGDSATTLSHLAPRRATLLFSRGGIRSAIVAQRLTGQGVPYVLSVKGGIQEWIASGAGLGITELSRLGRPAEQAWPEFRQASWFEQGLMVFSFFGIKTLYTLLAAAVTVLIWKRPEPELRALRRALISFLIGEACCFVNVIFYAERSIPLEHAHGLLMAVSLGFASYAALLWTTERFASAGETRPCAALALCGTCTNHEPRVCRLRRLAQLGVPMIAILATLPMMAELQGGARTTTVFGRLHGYWHPVVHQVFELRYLPAVAAGLFLWCEALLLLANPANSRLPRMVFSAALGAMGFSFLRLLFVAPFAHDLLWFVFWEELTELLYIATIIGTLWVFRSTWFARGASAS